MTRGRSADRLACPSGPAAVGATLLGIVGGDGTIGYIQPLITIDESFLTAAANGRALEERFRFSQPCVEASCGYWSDSECNVIEYAISQQPAAVPSGWQLAIPRCAIRPNCRWFHQRGVTACRVCRFVVTKVDRTGREYLEAAIPDASAASVG